MLYLLAMHCEVKCAKRMMVDPEAVAYEFYGWLMALYCWLAGLKSA